MSSAEQEKIIRELRKEALKIGGADKLGFADKPKATKLDKKTVWEKARLAGETISDDTLSTPHPAGA